MKKALLLVVSIVLTMTLFVGCAAPAQTTETAETPETSEAAPAEEAAEPAVEAETEVVEGEVALEETEWLPIVPDDLDEVQPIEGVGPNGETPIGLAELEAMVSEEIGNKVKEGGFTAAVSLHTTAQDWSTLQIRGIEEILNKYGVEILTITDAELDVEKQISDYETIIDLKPDLMICFVLDKDAAAPVLQKAVDAGIKLSFIDAIPTGFEHGVDYAGMGTANDYVNGKASARKLAEEIGGEGQVAVMKYKASLYHVDQRYEGAMDAFAEFPGIEVVDEQGFLTPDEAATITENLLVAHPDLKGIWYFVDGGAMAGAGVIQNLDKDVKVAGVDLSVDSAYALVQGDTLVAIGGQHPYDQGKAEALIGILALAGEEAPPYVMVPGELVTAESMERSWNRIMRTEMPEDLM